MLTVLLAPIMWIYDLIRSQIGGTVKQIQQTSSDDQVLDPLTEMPQDPPNDRAGASGDKQRKARNPANGRYEQLRSRFRTQTAQLTSLENDHRQLTNEYESLQRSNRQLSEGHRVTKANLHETQITCQKQQQEINSLKEKLRSAGALLEARNQELKVARTFLSKEDPFSASDVVQSVRDLNSEIMQTAAYLAENLPLKRIRTPLAETVPEGPYRQIFVALVLPQGFGEDVDIASFELALQGFLVGQVFRIANVWGFSQASGWCIELYSKVCEIEDRTVASNWRALTRRTLRNIDSSREDLHRQIVLGVIEQLAELISSCGVGEVADNANQIYKHAADKLWSLFTAARKLNKMIGENVVSDDLMVSAIGGGHSFDGEHMEDTYGQGGVKPTQHAVICTTDLGLCEMDGPRAGKVLLKPKVALHNL